MTHKITIDQSQTAAPDFAALADQLIQGSWHLPPEGDQSWREQDALRIFSGHDKGDDEPPAAEDADAPGDESGPRLEPGFTPLRPAGILLSLTLATGLMFIVIVVSTPEILTTGFWSAPDAKAGAVPAPVAIVRADVASAAPLVPVQAVVPTETLRPSLTDSGKAALPLVREAADSAGTSHRKIRIAETPAKIRVAKASVAETPGVKVAARATPHRLAPIGEAYFSSHMPAVPARKAASADWKAEVARWDERANEIRARNQNTKND